MHRQATGIGMVAMAGALAWVGVSSAGAWDGNGHRMITRVALEGLDPSMPAWLRESDSVIACADQSQVPDRWRGVRVPQLTHINNPDHYINVEDLAPLGMTLRTMPPLRHEFARAVGEARSRPDFVPAPGDAVDPARDEFRTNEYPGFVLHAVLENYGKVVGAFRGVRMLEMVQREGDDSRRVQIEAAQWNARVHIGALSHFVGDIAQPLHTTNHHHGWVGENPAGYTTDRGFHAYIDGGVLRLHELRDDDIRAFFDAQREFDRRDRWAGVAAHVERSFALVEPLYKLQKSGELDGPIGKEFIARRLADAASELAAMIEAAWIEAAPTPRDTQDLIRFEGERGPGGGTPTNPAPAPAPAPGAGPGTEPTVAPPTGPRAPETPR